MAGVEQSIDEVFTDSLQIFVELPLPTKFLPVVDEITPITKMLYEIGSSFVLDGDELDDKTLGGYQVYLNELGYNFPNPESIAALIRSLDSENLVIYDKTGSQGEVFLATILASTVDARSVQFLTDGEYRTDFGDTIWTSFVKVVDGLALADIKPVVFVSDLIHQEIPYEEMEEQARASTLFFITKPGNTRKVFPDSAIVSYYPREDHDRTYYPSYEISKVTPKAW